ncbi:MAG: response regulator [Planctomycetota bacterium]|nr:MAG: response regulator [Planctomycetota bacterium]
MKARILLIDDEEVDFVITSRLLEQIPERAYELEWAETFEEGMRSLASQRHDVCLVDYRLGAKTGLDVLREASNQGLDIPMILLTGQGDDDVDLEAMSLGAAGYIDKDRIDSAVLDRTVRYALEHDRVVHDLVDHNRELLWLHKLTQIVLGREPEDEMYRRIASEIGSATSFPLVAIDLYDEDLDTITRAGAYGACIPVEASRHADQTVSGTVVRTRRPLIEMSFDGRDAVGQSAVWDGVATFMCLPMIADERATGALTLAHTEALAVDSQLVNRVASIANHLAALVEHRREPLQEHTHP